MPTIASMSFAARHSIPVTNLAPALSSYAESNHVYLNGFNAFEFWCGSLERNRPPAGRGNDCRGSLPATRREESHLHSGSSGLRSDPARDLPHSEFSSELRKRLVDAR